MPPALRIRPRTPAVGARGGPPRLHGHPLPLPVVADRIVEGWWRLTPRTRTVLGAAGAILAVAAVLLRIILAPYGPPVTVLVAGRDLTSGTQAESADVVTARWPRDLIPPSGPASREDLLGARLTTGVLAGTPLTRDHLRHDGPLADLATGAAAVPVPAALLRGADVGTLLDLVAVSGDGSGRTLAQDVRVLAVEGDTVWVEVRRERAADVAAAALRGILSGAVLAP